MRISTIYEAIFKTQKYRSTVHFIFNFLSLKVKLNGLSLTFILDLLKLDVTIYL
nr:MAG TPA: hypothetical protein [Caudoviricetes sp.]